MKTRDKRLDNLRCLLIFLVVFCHVLIEASTGDSTRTIYRAIYVFHMPTFVFVTGYFARFRPRRIVRGLLVPYLVFHTLASVRRNLVAGRAAFSGFSLLDPQWTLWYLFACVVWYITIPLLERVPQRPRSRLWMVAGTFAASLIVGFVPWVERPLCLSRIVVLYPFFCGGFYAGIYNLSAHLAACDARRGARIRLSSPFAVVLCMALLYAHGTPHKDVLYRHMAYASWWDFEARVLLQLAASAWCFALMVWTPNKDCGFISEIGGNTLCIYLLHPWLIRILRHAFPLPGGECAHIAESLLIAAAMLALLGNKRVGTTFKRTIAGT